jgi:hypothetical protein
MKMRRSGKTCGFPCSTTRLALATVGCGPAGCRSESALWPTCLRSPMDGNQEDGAKLTFGEREDG